ncbi:MAG: hypothetical protein A2W90_07590 [Bacteroidetes bacterium GWF2_42_66]|nr:MAG: hypothetical protein A2W92_07580 [Bacteroidetes bacterium GWA2_42_15]OFX96948.1 MAG: hypothetical protein A2W89_20290 [Bacteroidetes bacterium GWE2_42_39]OFY44705.1 MAG: hypothetical protein A2W90_07590 [Bacteroidetes bacterium GWF2_42_66]HBL75003.1 hypothetical protein [Prolixibacteraceae bacterium]HCU60324.1 hypothetical protein [Prolixibacteraceae bacterium]
MKKISDKIKNHAWGCIISVLFFLPVPLLNAQHTYSGYEIRYFSKDTKANGETDFKGETSTLNTDQRIEFLKYYADQVSSYYGDKNLNTEVVSDKEAIDFLKKIKPQPLPEVRERIPLDEWKYLSYRIGQHEESRWELNKYAGAKDLLITDGTLSFQGDTQWKWNFSVQTWRYFLSWKFRAENNANADFSILDNSTGKIFVKIAVNGTSCSYFSNKKKKEAVKCAPEEWHTIKVEADMVKVNGNQRFNLFVNDKLVGNYICANEDVLQSNGFEINASLGIQVDDIYGIGYQQTTEARHPFYPATFIDETFDEAPPVDGWQTDTYNDCKWKSVKLPFAQGSERNRGEDLYFRKKVTLKNFKRAYLNIETLDPGGEVWVNGKMVAFINERYPVRLDVTKFMKPFAENYIALKVTHFYLNPGEGNLMPCSYLDYNPGWFAGRTSLDLVGETFVNDAFFYTQSIEKGKANIHASIDLEHKGTLSFDGKIIVKMAPWDNAANLKTETVVENDVLCGPGIKTLLFDFPLENPKLWTPEIPSLYKVVIEVAKKDGTIIDDYVFTTGIRTVSQEGGTFRLNGKPAMLNGTQIMGFRWPLEKMMTWLRCPPDSWVAKEMLMVRKMNCNMLRVHVHGWKEKAVGVNDARYCELADQMGIMLIFATPAWIREGDWGQVDFDGYHKYMKQLQSHPSIVMWEVSNHPNTFKRHGAHESDLFCEKAYNAVYPYDPSRLISFTSHIGHLHYGNDAGTMDQGGDKIPSREQNEKMAVIGNQDALTNYGTDKELTGNKILPSKAWTAPMVTRGNQDAPTGYGSDWGRLRTWPWAYRQEFLDSKERAYFNFENMESIGQPNWELSKGKPWYHLNSYEWEYDEGSIGRKLQFNEWRESQAWQAFSAYESIKKLRILDYDGFSWCCLHGGANAGTYQKPVIDFTGHAKLAFHIHKTVYQPVLAGSNNVDIMYGPDDKITPMILNLGEQKMVTLTVVIKDKFKGQEIDKKVYENLFLPEGRTLTEVAPFKPSIANEGLYFIEYLIKQNDKVQ